MLNPYVLLGLIAAFLLTNGYTAYKVRDHYVVQCDSAKWQSQVKALQGQVALQTLAAASAAAERDRLRLRESELETVVLDYEKSFAKKPEQIGQKPEPVVACIDPRAARALRAIK